ncbi:MAG: hypothetical protein LH473_07745, partial [Chitinophagales bacterium]|nr:hypothetical protein [Chitinophagales bacterium]
YSQSLSRLFSDFLNGYTQAFNKWHYRKGRLFSETLNRKKIDNMQYLINPIHYIHLNPVHHGFCKHPGDWIYSSFNSLLSTKANKVEIQKVMELFNGIKNFEVQQNRAIEMKYFLELEF